MIITSPHTPATEFLSQDFLHDVRIGEVSRSNCTDSSKHTKLQGSSIESYQMNIIITKEEISLALLVIWLRQSSTHPHNSPRLNLKIESRTRSQQSEIHMRIIQNIHLSVEYDLGISFSKEVRFSRSRLWFRLPQRLIAFVLRQQQREDPRTSKTNHLLLHLSGRKFALGDCPSLRFCCSILEPTRSTQRS